MTLEEARALLTTLLKAYPELAGTMPEDPDPDDDVTPEPLPHVPLFLGEGNAGLWGKYNLLKATQENPLAPVLTIPEGAAQHGDWLQDGDLWIHGPSLALRDKWAAGDVNINFGRLTGAAADRVGKYAALHDTFFSTLWLTIPAGFTPSADEMDWIRDNWDASQRNKLFLSFGVGYIESRVFDDFSETPPAAIPGAVMLSGGNLFGEESIMDSIQRGRIAFETHLTITSFDVQRKIMNRAKARLRRLDKAWARLTDDEGRAAFMQLNPGYEPK